VALFAVGVPLAAVPALAAPALWTVWAAFTFVALCLVVADAAWGMPARRLRTQVDLPDTLYMGDPDPAIVRLRAAGAARVDVLGDVGDLLQPIPLVRVDLPAGEERRIELPLVPRRRGTAELRALWLRWTGPLGLVRRVARRRIDASLAVVPDVRAVRAAALRFFAAREALAGLKVEKYLGDGSEFDSLREYVPGMDHRALDWKASARHRKLLVQQFRAERNHQIIIAIDTGRLMGEPLGGVPKLDLALNAGLHLGYFGLRCGDRVGLFGFDEKVRIYVEPQPGVTAFPRLLRASAELDYGEGETNFTLGLSELATRLRRRSLVIVLTDFVDVIAAELMLENLDRLARRHLVVFVAIRDPELVAIASAPPRTTLALGRAVTAGDLVRERDVVLRRLRRLGVLCVDAPPGKVSVDLLDRYLEIKRRERI
jgi:uncharacterized protein (DUF58 family)